MVFSKSKQRPKPPIEEVSDDEPGTQGLDELAASIRDALTAKFTVVDKAPKRHESSQEKNAHNNPISPNADAECSEPSSSGEDEDRGQTESEAKDVWWRPKISKIKRVETRKADVQQQVVAQKEPSLAKQLMAPPRDPKVIAKAQKASLPDTAGKKWFDLPTTQITDDVKRELRLLRLRATFDPKRFYKSNERGKFPKYFQFGTVMDNPLDFYSSRLPNASRKRSMTEELLADAEVAATRKKRYSKLQAEAAKQTKVKKRKTDQPRMKRKTKSPKY